MFESTLQEISRSQSSGVLHVTADDSTLSIVVEHGYIVHVEESGVSQQLAVCEVLQQAGCLADAVVELLGNSDVSLEQLRQILVEKQYLSEWEFDQAKRSYELNLLYGLREIEDLEVAFSEAPVSPGPADILRIQPTELLLDMVELTLEQEKFLAQFGDPSSQQHYLQLGDIDEQVLSDRERIVCGIVADGCTTADVFELSLLSEQNVVTSLLSLVEKEFLTVQEGELLDDEYDEEDESEFADFDEDQPLFEGLFDDELEAEDSGDVAAGEGVFDGQGVWGAFDGDGEAIESAEHIDFDDTEGEELEEEMAFPAELEAESNRWAEKENDQANFNGPEAILRSLNYKLTEPSVIQNIVIAATSIYLLVFALIVPDLVETWFHVLADFTSISR